MVVFVLPFPDAIIILHKIIIVIHRHFGQDKINWVKHIEHQGIEHPMVKNMFLDVDSAVVVMVTSRPQCPAPLRNSSMPRMLELTAPPGIKTEQPDLDVEIECLHTVYRHKSSNRQVPCTDTAFAYLRVDQHRLNQTLQTMHLLRQVRRHLKQRTKHIVHAGQSVTASKSL